MGLELFDEVGFGEEGGEFAGGCGGFDVVDFFLDSKFLVDA